MLLQPHQRFCIKRHRTLDRTFSPLLHPSPHFTAPFVPFASLKVDTMALCMRKNALQAGARRATTSRARVVSVQAFKVTLKTPSGTQTIECPEDTYILVSPLDLTAQPAPCNPSSISLLHT